MTKESLSLPLDRPTVLVQKILGNEQVLRQFILEKDGNPLLKEETKKEIDTYDPQETDMLLKTIFCVLPDGDLWNQNQRHGALQILSLVNLNPIEPKILAKYFSSSLDKLKNDADPYGEIDAILQAGKIIAPYITQHRIMIRHRLNRLRTDFNKDEKAYTYIHNIQEEIEAIMLPPLSDIEAKVKELVGNGYSNKNISTSLNIANRKTEDIIEKLRRRQEMPPGKSGRRKIYIS